MCHQITHSTDPGVLLHLVVPLPNLHFVASTADHQASAAGLRAKTTYGGEKRNRFLLETTGCGAAFFDYDHDGWLDIFLVNGSRFEASWTPVNAPVSRLYRNNRDGTFTDVTAHAGIARTGWGCGCCVGDFDNDGWDDLFVSYWGDCSLWKNLGNGKFADVAREAGVTTRTRTGLQRHNTGCAFLDYDKDGQLDLFVANYIDFDPKTAPLPESGPCQYKGLVVACDPPGLAGGKNILFHNNDGDLDLLVNCINDVPQLLRCDSRLKTNWIKVKTLGVKSNRTGIGARIYRTTSVAGQRHRQMDEVSSGGSYLSQSDLRVHFGLGTAATADIEVRWPSGIVDSLPDMSANRVLTVVEGQGLTRR